ncbi:MAG: hypothetical protein COA79_15470 [Planctomycetota bacterium]|nr:MAG: hypothetical protein COA79_15470 [Planctomycetota bacterium]
MSYINNRLLIVDDNPSIHEDFQKVLEKSTTPKSAELDELSKVLFGEEEAKEKSKNIEYRLEFALQGKLALEMVIKSIEDDDPYSLIFMDVRMPPGWDGIETVQQIWSVDSRVQVVLCTAYSDYNWIDIRNKLKNVHNLLILKKPFEGIEVLQLAISLTSRWGMARQIEMKSSELEELIQKRTADLTNKTLALYDAEKLTSVGVLAGGVAHEFNNINASILGYAEIILMAKSNKSDSEHYLKRIKSAALKGKHITNNLLMFAGMGNFEKQDYAISKIVVNVLEILQQDIEKYSVSISKDLKQVPDIVMDPSMVTQVVLHLVENAIDSMIEMEKKEVYIKLFSDREWVYLSIEDCGSGISKELMKSIFDPFFTTKGPNTAVPGPKSLTSGTGLGLSVSQAILANHNGDIQVYSDEGKGTTFTVKLPNAQK